MATWNELRLFWLKFVKLFKKIKKPFKKAMALNDNIPYQYNKPQIKSRISTLITKVRLWIYIFIWTTFQIKVVHMIAEINNELSSLQRQMDKKSLKK
jgi:hypothetical protein